MLWPQETVAQTHRTFPIEEVSAVEFTRLFPKGWRKPSCCSKLQTRRIHNIFISCCYDTCVRPTQDAYEDKKMRKRREANDWALLCYQGSSLPLYEASTNTNTRSCLLSPHAAPLLAGRSFAMRGTEQSLHTSHFL